MENQSKNKQRKTLIVISATSVSSILTIIIIWSLVLKNEAKLYKTKVNTLNIHIKSFKKKYSQVIRNQKKSNGRSEQIKYVRYLQKEQAQPTKVLYELSLKIPHNVFLTKIRRENESLSIWGTSQTHKAITSFIKNIKKSNFFTNPILKEIKMNDLIHFILVCEIRR